MEIGPGENRHVLLLNWRDTLNPEGGGSEVFAERIAEELSGQGYRVTIFCAAHANGPAEEHRPNGVNLLRRGNRVTVYARAALTYLAGAVGLGRLARKDLGRPDLIVDVGNGIPFFSRIYARKPVVALIHHVHREQWPVVMGEHLARIGWWLESRAAPWVYRGCKYVTVSEATRRELATLGIESDRVTVVHNGTPELPVIETQRDPHPHLLMLGRLVPHKRVEIALRTTAQLWRDLPGLQLTIAGMGWWEPHLRETACELGIGDRVTFAGFVSDEEKQRLLGRAWVALTPSLKEGWGLTIVEAAAAGTPSVAFAAAGGVTEALSDGVTGLLADDEEHFVSLVRSLLTDDARREAMGAAAREHAGLFTWQNSGKQIGSLLETL